MNYLIGATLALLVAVFARVAGFDRDRSFYPTVLLVVASYYVLFAATGGSTRALALEAMVMGVFGLCAVVGLKRNLWLVAAALAAHGVQDFFHSHIVSNPGVPEWWPGFCMAYDVAAAASLAWLLKVSFTRPIGAEAALSPTADCLSRDALHRFAPRVGGITRD